MAGFTIRTRPFAFEQLRPFVTVQSDTSPAGLATRRRLPGEGTDAFISWGAASRFLQPEFEQPYNTNQSFSITATFPEDDTEDEEEPEVQVYDEIRREVSVIRVENPDDAAQFVDVERIEVIDFRGPAGITVRFRLNHDD